jgi:5,10-methylenetetrahydromethanopterin reductase
MTQGMTPEALPEIGIRLSGTVEPRRCVTLAKAAEDAGLAAVWFAENPFQRGVMPTVGACAAATRRVRIGVGVVNPYSRHPAQIAMEFAALDELSEGRAILGISSGIAAAVQRMGFAVDRPVTAVREAVAILRGLLAGESVTARGRVFAVDAARLAFPTLRHSLPIYMAATGMRGLAVCGAIADGWIVSNLTPLRTTERLLGVVCEAAAQAGRPTPRVVQYVPCVARPDGDAARAVVKTVIGEMAAYFWPADDDWPAAKEALVAESGIPRAEFVEALSRLRRGDDPVRVLDERFVTAFAIAGTAEECLAQTARYRAVGIDELALTFAGAQPETDIAYLGAALQ